MSLPTLEAMVLHKYSSNLPPVMEEPKPIFERNFKISKNESQPLLIYQEENWEEQIETFAKYHDLDINQK